MKKIIVENEIELEITEAIHITDYTKNPCKCCKIRWICHNLEENELVVENFPELINGDCVGIVKEIKIIRGEELYNSLKKVYTISDDYDEIYPDDFMKKFCIKNMCPYKKENLSCFDEIDSCPFKLLFEKNEINCKEKQ